MKQGRLKVTTVYSESWTSVAEYETFTYQEDGQPVSVTVDVLNTNHSASVYWGVDVHTDPAEVFNAENTTFEWIVQPSEEHGWIETGDDLDDFTTCGTYTRKATGSEANVVENVPATFGNGTFVLEVFPGGGNGQLVQRATLCNKSDQFAAQRAYYGGTWGAWVTTLNTQKVLWSGAYYMNGTQTVNLAEAVSEQESGIVLVFSSYNEETNQPVDSEFVEYRVSKKFVALHPGCGVSVALESYDGAIKGHKYLYVHDDRVVGNAINNQNVTKGGTAYQNKHWALRYVLGC